MEIKRTFDLLDRYSSLFKKDVAFAVKLNRKWVEYSSQEYIDFSYQLSYGLMAMGFRKGDKIASISNNRPEWNFIDMAMAMIGVVHVPLYTSLGCEEYDHILKHSDARLVFIGDAKLLKGIKPVADDVSNVEGVYTFDKIDGEKHWTEIAELGKENAAKFKDELETIKAGIQPDDLASLIYTSGTTGVSKGVMLSHDNLVRNFLAAAEVFDMSSDQRYLSILPLCHVGGRMGNYQTQYSGCAIYYAESMGTIAADMKDIKPHGFDAVPRILEKIFDTILTKGGKLTGAKKKIFFWAVKLGLKYKPPGESSWLYQRKLKIADKLIFSKWREAIGGEAQMVGCGGAALQARVERIFWAAGIKVLNMYGLTETSPVITINRRSLPELRLSTVGSLIEGVEMKIAEDGEILCKGHNVMLGYYKDPDLTAASFTDDGWFKTGDIGSIEDGKFLRVTDRKKEIFKLSSGKYIVPQSIENKFKESLFIEQMMVVGENEKFASALIAPDFAYLKEWGKSLDIKVDDTSLLIEDARFKEALKKEVKRFNEEVAEFEQIKRYKVVPDVWSPAGGELSPTLKLKRKAVGEKYAALIESIHCKK